MIVRVMQEKDIPAIREIWNDIIEDGVAFPQLDLLSLKEAQDFFKAQPYTGVAEDHGEIVGMYILHPNNVGRCSHIGNTSYGVKKGKRGLHIGEALVKDSIVQAKKLGYSLIQLNAVVDANIHARHLYERVGFVEVGKIPHGFRMKDGHFEDIHVMYFDLCR